jgi:hypothetical protein
MVGDSGVKGGRRHGRGEREASAGSGGRAGEHVRKGKGISAMALDLTGPGEKDGPFVRTTRECG